VALNFCPKAWDKTRKTPLAQTCRYVCSPFLGFYWQDESPSAEQPDFQPDKKRLKGYLDLFVEKLYQKIHEIRRNNWKMDEK